jgi:hypothetical protein
MAAHDPTTSKRCSKCRETKPVADFQVHRGNPDGLQAHCRPCRNAYSKAMYERKRAARISWTLPPDPYSDDLYSIFFVWFKPTPEFPGYGVDTDGIVWCCLALGYRSVGYARKWRKISPRSNPNGNLYVALYRDGIRHDIGVHRLVLATFIGPCPPGKEACHFDDVGTNNRLRNLRYDTHAGNLEDRDRNGGTAIGSRHARAKHVESEIAKAKGMMLRGMSPTEVAKETGIPRGRLYAIKHGRSWTHVEPEK